MMVPIATYAGELWHQASDQQEKRIQGQINKIARFAVNAPRFMSNEKLHAELNLETLDAIIFRRTHNVLLRTATHENDAIRRIVNPTRRLRNEGVKQVKRRAEEKGLKLQPPKRSRKT
ncbi:hypothetical protein Trydic_g15376 [Trypoxylus dichotomus]